MFEQIIERINKLNAGIKFSVYEKDNFTILSLAGQVDTYNSKLFTEELSNLIKETTLKQIVLDLEKIIYVSSSGIGSFLDILKLCADKNIDLYLLTVQPKVEEVFQLLGFTAFLNFISDLTEITSKKQSAFPLVIQCPHCQAKLKAVKPGKFKCPSCKEPFKIDDNGKVE